MDELRHGQAARDFMDGALVSWVKTLCTPEERGGDGDIGYNDLADGALLLDIMRKIEPRKVESKRQRVEGSGHSWSERLVILSSVLQHICACYQESLHQVIVMPLPDVLALARDPHSERSVQELRRVLLLMLGCAVQCENKEAFIEKITQLDLETQAAIVNHIKEVTHNPENVLDLHWADSNAAESPDLPNHSSLANRLRDVVEERDSFSQTVVDLTLELERLRAAPEPPAALVGNGVAADPPGSVANHWDKLDSPADKAAASPAESNVKLRRAQQELDEKKEELTDVKQDVQRLHSEVQRLRHENSQLVSEACSARAYRDELDAAHERAERAERLYGEVARLRERLRDADFYKSRVEELREDNALLLEAKALLEEKVEAGKALAVRQHELERDNAALSARLLHMETEREEEQHRLEELTQDHLALESAQRRSLDETAHLGAELERLTHASGLTSTPSSLSVEVNESASRQLLRVERENLALHRSVQELSAQLQKAQEEAQRQRLVPTLHGAGEEAAGVAGWHNGYDGGGDGGGGDGMAARRAAPSFSILDEKLEELERENERLAAENARLSRGQGCAQKLEFTTEIRRAQQQQQQEAAQLVRSQHEQQQQQQLKLRLQEAETFSERLRQENEKLRCSFGLLQAREDRAKVDLRRLDDVESENARLLQRALSDKLSLAMLQEELSQERLRAGRVREELGELREEMENSTTMVGFLEPSRVDGRLGSSLHHSPGGGGGGGSHPTSHETCRKALEGKTEQISILETQLEESMVLNTLLQEELQNVMRNRDESIQQPVGSSFTTPERSSGDLLAEVATLRERTVTLEAENAKLQEESGPALTRAAALTAALQRSRQRSTQLELRAERSELALAEARRDAEEARRDAEEARRDAEEARRSRDAAEAEARALAGLEARVEEEFREALAARQRLQAAYLRLEEHSRGLEQSLAEVSAWDRKVDAQTPDHHRSKGRDNASYLDGSSILNDNNLTSVDGRLGCETAVMDQYTFVESGRRKGVGAGGWLTSTVKKLIKPKREAEREKERSGDHGAEGTTTRDADGMRHGTASNSSSPGSGVMVTKANNSGSIQKQENRSYVGGSFTRKDDAQASGKWSVSGDERGAPRKGGGGGGPPPPPNPTADAERPADRSSDQGHPVKRSASLYIPRQRFASRGQPLTGSFRQPTQHRSGTATTSTPTDDQLHHPSHPSDVPDTEVAGGSPSNHGSLLRPDDSAASAHRNVLPHAGTTGSLGRPPSGPRGKPQPRTAAAAVASAVGASARWSVSGDGSGWNRATQTLDRPRSPNAAHRHRLSLSLAAVPPPPQQQSRTGSNSSAFFYAPPAVAAPEAKPSEAPDSDRGKTRADSPTPPPRGGGKCDKRQEGNLSAEAAGNGDVSRADDRADSPLSSSAEQTVWYEYGCA
ncbi:uncharacterized protein LOC116953879 isoform X1 [Petromyzon marinus]|uniref:uncharacterized protein LOC116953879 isoform X1 n=1 Tax=Petromyzon marinus TaxID=7757 RepID=UPI003F7298C3